MSSNLFTRRRGTQAAVASITALGLAAAPLAAFANDGDAPLPEPSDREFSLGQSMQIRVNADAEPNSELADFRWTVNQLVVQGPEDGDAEVPIPEDGDLLRSLITFDQPPQEDGIATLTADVQDGVGVARTVSLFPQDGEPPVTLDAEFTLDGEPISADDLVGKSGVVTATYTLTNLSTEEKTVKVENLAGKKVKTKVEADVPMVGLGKQLVPQSWGGLSVKGGAIGADGRGNTQIQFITLPFRPLSADGTATFGWAARVQDAIVPSMLMQVAPIYIPKPDDKNKEKQEEGGTGLGVQGPNLDPAVAQIQAGVAQLIQGIEQLTADDGSPDPLTVLQGNINDFFNEFGTNLQTTAELVDPNNPEGATALVNELSKLLSDLNTELQTIQDSDALDRLDAAAKRFTPEQAAQLAELAPYLQRIVDNIVILSGAINTYCAIPEKLRPSLPPPLGRPLTNAECNQVKQVVQLFQDPQIQDAIGQLNQYAEQLVPAAEALATLNRQLPGVITTLIPVTNSLVGVLDSLSGALEGLSAELKIIGKGLADSNVELPTLDEVISAVVTAVLESPGGQNITGGLDQIGAGIGDAKSVLGDFLAEVVVSVTAAAEKGKKAIKNADEALIKVKASVVGLVEMAHTSPLPYGGDPQDAPEGTVLAGAYEFRVDAADGNLPQTLPRVLIGIALIVVAGVIGVVAARRDEGDEGGEGDQSGEGGEGGSGAEEVAPTSTG